MVTIFLNRVRPSHHSRNITRQITRTRNRYAKNDEICILKSCFEEMSLIGRGITRYVSFQGGAVVG